MFNRFVVGIFETIQDTLLISPPEQNIPEQVVQQVVQKPFSERYSDLMRESAMMSDRMPGLFIDGVEFTPLDEPLVISRWMSHTINKSTYENTLLPPKLNPTNRAPIILIPDDFEARFSQAEKDELTTRLRTALTKQNRFPLYDVLVKNFAEEKPDIDKLRKFYDSLEKDVDTPKPLLSKLDFYIRKKIEAHFIQLRDQFIVSLETISSLKKAINESSAPIENFIDPQVDQEVSQQQFDRAMRELEREQRLTVFLLKLKLIREVGDFIKNTKALILSGNGSNDEMIRELRTVLSGDIELYNELVIDFHRFATAEEKKQVGNFEELFLDDVKDKEKYRSLIPVYVNPLLRLQEESYVRGMIRSHGPGLHDGLTIFRARQASRKEPEPAPAQSIARKISRDSL